MNRTTPGRKTSSGVFVLDDFRDNLIVDRYDPIFTRMRGSKLAHLRSENSEDALTWNVFRSLRQVDASLWAGRLASKCFRSRLRVDSREVALELWRTFAPPPSLRRLQKDEGESEIDVTIETPDFVWFLEAKYKSDISVRTTANEHRDQVLRNVDVGSYYAGRRDFYFSLLILNASRSPLGVAAVEKYSGSRARLRRVLPHRSDGCSNIRGIGTLRWVDLAEVLAFCSNRARLADECRCAGEALKWLAERGISPVEKHAG